LLIACASIDHPSAFYDVSNHFRRHFSLTVGIVKIENAGNLAMANSVTFAFGMVVRFALIFPLRSAFPGKIGKMGSMRSF
jgi:hypothetical protein